MSREATIRKFRRVRQEGAREVGREVEHYGLPAILAVASFGPFFVQTSRIFLYAIYFFAGIALGAHGLERGLLSRDSALARRWPLWVFVALFAFAASVVAFVVGVVPTLAKGGPGPVAGAVSNFAFVLSCAASSLLFLALCLRFARTPNRVMDSLSANAFGIYLVHYACVSWLQLALLSTPVRAR